METIAVYWEERIKVYGITPKYGLALATINIPRSELTATAETLAELEKTINRFELITAHSIDDGIDLHLLIEISHVDTIRSAFLTLLPAENKTQISYTTPVDLLYLHGPHFQDRFGILNATLSALSKHQIELVCSGCAGTSMYLVLQDGIGPQGLKLLRDAFLIPTSC